MKMKLKLSIVTSLLVVSCSDSTYEIKNKFNTDHTTTVYLLKNHRNIDSLIVNDYYGYDSIVTLKKNQWNFIYSTRCGSGCSSGNQIIFSVLDDKLNKDLHIGAYYKEGILGDETFKKYFKSIIAIENLNQKNLELKYTRIKNDVENYSTVEKLIIDPNKNIYYNREFNLENKIYKGVKIDSFEYIYYEGKWFEFNNKEKKIYQEL